MKYLPSIAFEEMSGSAKGVTAAKTRGRKYIRNRGYGGSVRTSGQASVKAVFKQLSQAWQSLTNAQILAWNSAAQSAEARSVLGTKTKITGSNLFMRLNYWVVYCDGSVMSNPPALTGVEAPADATITLTDAAFTFKLNSVPSVTTNLKLIICASAPQSNGISRAYSKAAEIGGPETPSTTAVDIKDDYEAKYGAVSAGNPKVFFKYFFVDVTTGEKSGEMLAVAKFTASEDWNDAPDTPGGSDSGGASGDDPGQGPDIETTHRLSLTSDDPSLGKVKIGNGLVGSSAEQDIVEGSSVQIHAIAESGGRFVSWSDGNTEETRTVTVTEDMEFQADFAQMF